MTYLLVKIISTDGGEEKDNKQNNKTKCKKFDANFFLTLRYNEMLHRDLKL